MCAWNKSDPCVATVQLNAELRHAQLELLSAECATDRLRLRFSSEDIARYGERSVLRKAVASANALKDYYTDIARQISDPNSIPAPGESSIPEEKVLSTIDRLRQYLHDQRNEYRYQGVPLGADQCRPMIPFFSPSLLEEVRIVRLQNHRVPNPPFYAEAKALGLNNLPDLAHMASLTFEDVVIFPGEINDRRLFHALVHVAQFKILGLERYAELFVRGFLRTRAHVCVPIEMQALGLEAKFAEQPEPFSVEEAVRVWAHQGRY